ncbi:hypothetical protein F511_44869 [Dorcoceras hygrometricum]|uniref:Uncharacterized protein n=1 Tax=Dorcoceras hygrometricum TaxID=472368 RepID=A0A2Z7D962_9LAMI|nr:hypothetical protein F511_44869 [Dorcoceras hygrometricum]
MLMTSSVTSSSRKNQQVACIPDARGSDVVEEIQSQATVQSADGDKRKQNDVVYITDEATVDPVATQRYSVAMFCSSSRKKIQAKHLMNQMQATAASSRELI